MRVYPLQYRHLHVVMQYGDAPAERSVAACLWWESGVWVTTLAQCDRGLRCAR